MISLRIFKGDSQSARRAETRIRTLLSNLLLACGEKNVKIAPTLQMWQQRVALPENAQQRLDRAVRCAMGDCEESRAENEEASPMQAMERLRETFHEAEILEWLENVRKLVVRQLARDDSKLCKFFRTPCCDDGTRSFVRVMLRHQPNEYALLALIWPPQMVSSLHGHDKGECFFRVLQGQIEERQFAVDYDVVRDAHDHPPRGVPKLVKTTSMTAPCETVGNISDRARVFHRIANTCDSTHAVTLHLYAGAWDNAWVYCERRGKWCLYQVCGDMPIDMLAVDQDAHCSSSSNASDA
ncbi:MAG: hypothetical protein MHM6MM_001884 [Cercozoa sp. M6MM]